jgi:hypothetical protein
VSVHTHTQYYSTLQLGKQSVLPTTCRPGPKEAVWLQQVSCGNPHNTKTHKAKRKHH